jgi:hypothetical protein
MRCLPLDRPLMLNGLVHAAQGLPSTRQENVTPTSVVVNTTTTGRPSPGTDTDTIVGFAGFAVLPELAELGLGVAEAVALGEGFTELLAEGDGAAVEPPPRACGVVDGEGPLTRGVSDFGPAAGDTGVDAAWLVGLVERVGRGSLGDVAVEGVPRLRLDGGAEVRLLGAPVAD